MGLIDLFSIIFVALWAYWGYRRGAIFTLADLFGFAVSVLLALKIYPPIGDYLAERFSTTNSLGNLAAFIGVFAALHTLYMWFLMKIYRPLPGILSVRNWRLPDRLLGILPGITVGVLWLGCIFAFLTWFPFSGTAKAAIQNSAIGRSLVSEATRAEPQIERLFGPVARDSIGFITVRNAEEKRSISVPKQRDVSVDRNSEFQMLDKINAARREVGLPRLVMDEKLRIVARKHSEEMFRLGYFSHNSPVSGSPFDRMGKAGIKYLLAGENIAYAQNVDLAHEGLMNSKPHRENILTPDFGKVGIGIVDAGLYGEMFTQDFTD